MRVEQSQQISKEMFHKVLELAVGVWWRTAMIVEGLEHVSWVDAQGAELVQPRKVTASVGPNSSIPMPVRRP